MFPIPARFLVLSFFLAIRLDGEQLRSVTLQAWKAYLRTVSMREAMLGKDRLVCADFSDRLRLQRGEVIVRPVAHRGMTKIPDALIHHWIGHLFIPGATTADVLSFVQDFTCYKNAYAPLVVDSQRLSREGENQEFSVVMVSRGLFGTNALSARCSATFKQIAEGFWSNQVSSLEIREIKSFGTVEQHELTPGEGAGYVWGMSSFSHYQQRDNGVYVEIEALALSRTMPPATRWILEPVVRRVAQNSLEGSLTKMRLAVRARCEQRDLPHRLDK